MENSISIYEEQFEAQRTMLEDALMALDEKNKILEKANYALEEKRFELEQFIYRLNHDFKSPVATIKGLINLLSYDDIAKQSIIDNLKDTIYRLDCLITNLSYFYITTQVSNELLQIANVLSSSAAKFNNDLIKHNVKFTKSSIVDLKVNSSDFDTIFSSLISNSINFYDINKTDRSINININKDNEFINITVEDNGIGIEVEHQKIVFDIFTKISSRSSGVGLGLYIVTKIVKKYDGIIYLKSEVNIGTQIKICVPICNLS